MQAMPVTTGQEVPQKGAQDARRPAPVVILMPFEDAEEERLWDEIAEMRRR